MQRRSPLRLAAVVVAAVVVGGVLGFAIHVGRVGGLAAWLAGAGSAPLDTTPPYEARGSLVDVGGGRSVYLDCRGAGSPTVILEQGLGGGADGWGSVLDGIAGMTRVCAWDRPGIGRSPSRGMHSGADTAVDLHAALDRAGEPGPFVVVAFSLGGMYARLFASTAPGSVAAFLMLDIYEPDLGMADDPALSPELRATMRRNLDAGNASIAASEQLDLPATLAALEPITPEPAILMMVDQHQRYVDPDPGVTEALVAAWTRAFAAHYPKGRFETAPTSHFVHLDRPDLVIERVRQLVDEQRAA